MAVSRASIFRLMICRIYYLGKVLGGMKQVVVRIIVVCYFGVVEPFAKVDCLG